MQNLQISSISLIAIQYHQQFTNVNRISLANTQRDYYTKRYKIAEVELRMDKQG